MAIKFKKGYMRTLEAVGVIILTLSFLLYLIPQFQGNEVHKERLDVIDEVMYNENFRNCVLTTSIITAKTCSETYFLDLIPKIYEFKVEISDINRFLGTDLPDKEVFTETIMLVGNITTYSPRYVKLYYWIDE